MKQLILIGLLLGSIMPGLRAEGPPQPPRPPAAKEEPKEEPKVSTGERIEIPDVGFSIVPPNGWMVHKNSHGSSLLFEAPKQPNQIYQPTIQIMVFNKLRYIDEVTMKEYGDLIVEKFGKMSNRVTGYHLRDAAIQRLETGDPSILYYTEFQYDDVPIMQMHILISSATNHFVMTYTDIAKVFEDESSPGLAIAYTSMHSAQLDSRPPWRWRGFVIAGGAVFLVILGWFTLRFLRARRMAKLGQRIEDEDNKEITRDEESQYYSRHSPATHADSHVGDDEWANSKPQSKAAAKVSQVQSSHFDEDDEPEVSDVVPISTLEKSLHPARKRRQESSAAAPRHPAPPPISQQPVSQHPPISNHLGMPGMAPVPPPHAQPGQVVNAGQPMHPGMHAQGMNPSQPMHPGMPGQAVNPQGMHPGMPMNPTQTAHPGVPPHATDPSQTMQPGTPGYGHNPSQTMHPGVPAHAVNPQGMQGVNPAQAVHPGMPSVNSQGVPHGMNPAGMPVNGMDPSQNAHPGVNAMNPSQAMHPGVPANGMNPAHGMPANAGNPSQNVHQGMPANAGNPSQNVHQGMPANAGNPSQNAHPGVNAMNSSQAMHPGMPVNSMDPSHGMPANTMDPSQTFHPGMHSTAMNSSQTAQPGVHANTVNPSQTAHPGMPANAMSPTHSAHPGMPANGMNPSQTAHSGMPNAHAQSMNAAQNAHPGMPGHPVNAQGVNPGVPQAHAMNSPQPAHPGMAAQQGMTPTPYDGSAHGMPANNAAAQTQPNAFAPNAAAMPSHAMPQPPAMAGYPHAAPAPAYPQDQQPVSQHPFAAPAVPPAAPPASIPDAVMPVNAQFAQDQATVASFQPQPAYVQKAAAPAASSFAASAPTTVSAMPQFVAPAEPVSEPPVTASRPNTSQMSRKQPLSQNADDEPEMTEEARLSEILPKAGTIEKSKPKRKGLFWRKKTEDDDDQDEVNEDKASWNVPAAKKSKGKSDDDDNDGDAADEWSVAASDDSPADPVEKDDDESAESDAWAPEATKKSDPKRDSLLNETQGPQRLVRRTPQGPVTKEQNNAAVTEDGWNLSPEVASDHDEEDEEEVG